MLIVITAFVLLLLISLALVWITALRAPEGYEDQAGFHATAETTMAGEKSVSESNHPMASKPHNDHEPIAA